MPKRTYYTYNGETLDMTGWARRTGIDHRTLWYRIKSLKWSLEKALTEPNQDHHLQPGIMRWCPIHEVAWCQEPVHTPSYWHPMRRHMLAYAMAYAKAFGCDGQITICISSCAICKEEKARR